MRPIAFNPNLAAFAAAIAATALPIAAQNEIDDSGEIYELSPFVVQESAVGYQATSTLAGSRIRTPLRDLGSSITILTEQFLDDTAANDAASALNYVANAEVGGPLGNFSASEYTGRDNNTLDARRNIGGAQRIRGLVNAQLTRDYFRTNLPFDTYNTSTVTINRGPNSVLFGLGSPGGVIENSLSMPIFGGEFAEVSIRLDQYGSHRETLDYNKTLIEDRLAVRVAALNNQKQYRQEPAFDNDQRVYAAFDWVIRPDEGDHWLGKTSLRGNFEYGDIHGTPPDVLPPVAEYFTWWDGHDVQALLDQVPGLKLSDFQNHEIPLELGGTMVPMRILPNFDTAFLDSPRQSPFWDNIGWVFQGPTEQQASLGGELSHLQGYQARARFSDILVETQWTDDPRSELTGFTRQSVPRSAFDSVNMLIEGNNSWRDMDFDAQQVNFSQQLFENKAGFEIAYNRQFSKLDEQMLFADGNEKALHVDISEKFSNGVINHNVGRPVMRAMNGINPTKNLREDETMRATAFATFDFNDLIAKDNVGKWLGKHTITGFYEEYSSDTKQFRRRLHAESFDKNLGASEYLYGSFAQGRRRVIPQVYLGDSVLGTSGPEAVKVNSYIRVPIQELMPGDTFDIYHFNRGPAQRHETTTLYTSWALLGGDRARNEIDSDALVLQSEWLDGHLVTLFAERSDTVRNIERLRDSSSLPRFLPDGQFNPDLLFLQDAPSFEQTGDTTTESYVLHFPEKYLFELPFGSNLSAHYFKSESFQPGGVAINILGDTVSSPSGETKEHGFTIELFERRLSARFNWYETSINNSRTDVNGAIGQFVARIGMWLERWNDAKLIGRPFAETGGLAAGVDNYDDMLGVIRNWVPEPARSLIGWQLDQDGTPRTNDTSGITSTFDFVSEGFEFELTGSITPSWSLAFNLAKQETVQSNTAPFFKEFGFAVRDNLIRDGVADVLDSPNILGEDDTFLQRWNGSVTFPLVAALAQDGTVSPEQRKWRWNVVTNYEFQEGRLDGFGFGGAGRWQDDIAIGYPFLLDEDGNQIPDIANPYRGDSEFNADFWVSYKKSIFKDIDWKVQLHMRNAIGGSGDDLIPVFAQPTGEHVVFRIPPERQIFLTNTFNF